MDFESVYLTMTGLLCPEYQEEGVENAFSAGSFCEQEYEKVRTAYLRICRRLDCGEEDRDLDAILFAMEAIQKALCKRMWDLGQKHK